MFTKLVDGIKVPLSEEEIAEVKAKEKALQDELPLRKAKVIRSKRDTLLAKTDWWASTDLTMTQEQIDYRQALRDITTQDGFPHDVVWPVKPE